MKIELVAFQRFTRCPQLYKLHDIEGVPMPPTSRQIISRVVRETIQWLWNPPDPTPLQLRTFVDRKIQEHFLHDAAYTDEESRRGVVHTMKLAYQGTIALTTLWRVTVQPRVNIVDRGRSFEHRTGEHTVTGTVEMDEPNAIRITRVRTRRPDNNEAAHDLSLALMGARSNEVIVDYLIDSEPLKVDRQVVEHSEGRCAAARERLNLMAKCIELNVFPPTDSMYWRCQSCQLRSCCRYV